MAESEQGAPRSIGWMFLWRWAVTFILVPFVVGLVSPIKYRPYERTQEFFGAEVAASILLAWMWVWWSTRKSQMRSQ